MPAFLRHIASASERRLPHSTAAAYTGELLLDFYRGDLCLVFLQLLFDYRSLAELRAAFPDVRVEKHEAEVLLCALFPKKFSWVLG